MLSIKAIIKRAFPLKPLNVEDNGRTFKILDELGVDYSQGYYFRKTNVQDIMDA